MKIKTITLLIIILLCFSCNNTQNKITSKELLTSIKQGEKVYQNFCINCHMPNGEGILNIYPPLANSDYLTNNIKASIKATKYGLKGKITVNNITYNNVMSPMGLSDQEVANVMNYILNSWNNKNTTLITPEEVSKIQPK